MGNQGRWELLRAIYERYRKAGRTEKKVILSEFCANASDNRKYAIRLLNGPRPGRYKSHVRRGREVVARFPPNLDPTAAFLFVQYDKRHLDGLLRESSCDYSFVLFLPN